MNNLMQHVTMNLNTIKVLYKLRKYKSTFVRKFAKCKKILLLVYIKVNLTNYLN